MVRTLRWPIFILVALCTLASSLAVLMPGRGVTPPPVLGALGFDACPPPCWAGITVGETALADVGAHFETYVSAPRKQIDQADSGAVYWGMTGAADGNSRRTTAFSGNLLARSESRHVTYIHLNLDIPLWYLLLTLGPPDDVELHEPFPDVRHLEMVLHWSLPDLRAAAVVPVRQAEEWGLEARATAFSVAEAGPREGFGRSWRPWHVIGHTAWQGFAPIAHYLNQAAPGALTEHEPAA